MGSGCGGRAGGRRASGRAGREGRAGQGRLYRPFTAAHSLRRCRRRVRAIAVLDRTKEPGAVGEPLYQDVRDRPGRGWSGRRRALRRMPRVDRRTLRPVLQGVHARPWSRRCSTSSAASSPSNHFTIGIHDDVTHTSLEWDPDFSTDRNRPLRRRFLRPGRRRHGRRQQEHDQDHRRRHRLLRPGLFRLRLEEIRLGDRLASALRPDARSARPT